MDRLLKSVLTIREVKFRMDDDYVDRLSRQYSVIILICFGFLVSTKQFVGRPINCWCPAQFTDSHRDYADAICWASNTYYLPMAEVIPEENLQPQMNKKLVSYYQWVPLILIYQALLAFIPCLFWRSHSKSSGINLSAIMDAVRASSQTSYLEIREKTIGYVVSQIDRHLLIQRDYGTGIMARVRRIFAKICCMIGGKLYGNYLISGYMFTKASYFFNALGQLIFLEKFLKTDYHMYGLYVLERYLRGQDWAHTERFPRVTLCQFEMRHQARLHQYTVQCALPLNLFNEKLSIFLWFWFVFLAFITAANFLRWLFRSLYWPGHVQYVKKQIRIMDATPQVPGTLSKFVNNYLRPDGIFIVQLIEMNMGEAAAGEVVCGLWDRFSSEDKVIEDKQIGAEMSGISRGKIQNV